MNETNKDVVEQESDIDNTSSTSAFHEHIWWIALVIGVIVVFAVARRLSGIWH